MTFDLGEDFTLAGWSPDGQLLGLAQRTAQVLMDAAGNEKALAWRPGAQQVGGKATLSPDGRLVALLLDGDYRIELWSPLDEGAIQRLNVPGGQVQDVRFSSDGRRLAVRMYDGAVALIDVAACITGADGCGVPLRTISPRLPDATGAVLSPDASLLATEEVDGSIRLWQTTDGSLVRTFTGQAPAFSPDGKSIALQGRDNTLRLYRIEDGVLTWAFANPSLDQPVFSPDGRYLAWSSAENIHLAQLGSGVAVHTHQTAGPVARLSFVAEGTRLAWIEGNQAVSWPISLLVREPGDRPTLLRAIDEPDIRMETTDPETLLDSEQGGAYLAGLIEKYGLSQLDYRYWESYTAKPVRFPSGARGVLVNIGYSGKAPGFLFLFKDEGGQTRLVDWIPGPNGRLRPDLVTGEAPAGNLEPVALFPPTSEHGEVVKAMDSGHAGVGLGETGFSLIEIAEDGLRVLFKDISSRNALRMAEGEMVRNRHQFIDLDGDGTREIVVEQFYCQLVLRDDSWNEMFCEPIGRFTYQFDGVRYIVTSQDEG